MENDLLKSIKSKLRLFGIYQIAGGIIGLGLTVWIVSGVTTFTSAVIILLLLSTGLYTYSIYCGALLLKKRQSGLKHSLVNQFLQLVNFSILGYTFQYISGVFLTVGLDLTNSVLFTFNLGISQWQMTLNGSTEIFVININFVAFLLILFFEKQRKEIYKQQAVAQIESIGQFHDNL